MTRFDACILKYLHSRWVLGVWLLTCTTAHWQHRTRLTTTQFKFNPWLPMDFNSGGEQVKTAGRSHLTRFWKDGKPRVPNWNRPVLPRTGHVTLFSTCPWVRGHGASSYWTRGGLRCVCPPILAEKFHKPRSQDLGLEARERTDVFRVSLSDSHAEPIVEGHGNMQGHEAISQVLESFAFLFSWFRQWGR